MSRCCPSVTTCTFSYRRLSRSRARSRSIGVCSRDLRAIFLRIRRYERKLAAFQKLDSYQHAHSYNTRSVHRAGQKRLDIAGVACWVSPFGDAEVACASSTLLVLYVRMKIRDSSSPVLAPRSERALDLFLLETVHNVPGPPLPGGENPRVLNGSHAHYRTTGARPKTCSLPFVFFARKPTSASSKALTLLLPR